MFLRKTHQINLFGIESLFCLLLLIQSAVLADPKTDFFEKKIDKEISESVKHALEAPEPPSQELTKYIWAED